MAELAFPTAGGGAVTDANYENLASSYVPSGLVGKATGNVDLVYADSTGRSVKVRASRAAIVRGFRWETDGAGITRTIEANTSGQPRIDLAVLRLNRADWTLTFQIIKGTPATSPVAPAFTQQSGPAGVWELPLAEITVANAAVVIAPANVVNKAVYITQFVYSGNKAAPPGASLNAQFFYATDVARMYTNLGGTMALTGEAGSLVAGTAYAGWGTPFVFYQRVNGFTWMQAMVTRTGNDLPAGTLSYVFTIPVQYRPVHDIAAIGYSGGAVFKLYIDSATGLVQLNDYTVIFRKNAQLAVHPITWPSTSN